VLLKYVKIWHVIAGTAVVVLAGVAAIFLIYYGSRGEDADDMELNLLQNTDNGVATAIADSFNYIRVTLTGAEDEVDISLFRLRDVTGTGWENGTELQIREVGQTTSRVAGRLRFPVYHVYTEDPLDPQRHLKLSYGENQATAEGADVLMRGILDNYYYDGWLGYRWHESFSEFKLWTPVAVDVKVALYKDLNQTPGEGHYAPGGDMRVMSSFIDDPHQLFDMTRNASGVWSVDIPGNWADGDTQWWYMYRVLHPNGDIVFAIDPYATGVSANEGIGAIINDTKRGAPLRGDDDLNFLQRGYKIVDGERFDVERQAPEIRINPATGHPYQVDHIIYELHVRDFSIHPSSGIDPAYRGTFKAFTQRGTVAHRHRAVRPCTAEDPFDVSLCTNEKCWVIPVDENENEIRISTGLDHLIDLGITTVHLLPFYDQRNVNELMPDRQIYNTRNAMNWGYDPQNYNVPEGSYSTSPETPETRINELKEAVDAMHNAGLRVVMDVVYNHTASVYDGPFQNSVPYYYHRTWCTGEIAEAGSGCGNELADERPMVRKYIIDSVLYWQREYGIDGFRFDLMWLHDINTMKAIVRELRAVDPTVLIYGEPWAASSGGSPLNYIYLFNDSNGNLREEFEVMPRPSSAMNISGNGFAFFNDTTRNMLRGGNRDPSSGFINGGIRSAVTGELWRSIRAATSNVSWASESINYVSKHDDMVLFDNNAWSLGSSLGGIDAAGSSNWSTPQFFSQYRTVDNEAFRHDPHHTINRNDLMSSNLVRSCTLGTGIILTSQGVPFMHAADSFLRSKRGHENTFNSDDFFNSIRWDHKIEFYEVYEYFKGLIKLRRSCPAFRMDSREEINNAYHPIFPNPPASVVSGGEDLLLVYRIAGNSGGDPSPDIFVALNGASFPRNVNFMWHETLNVVADYKNAGTDVLWTISPDETVTIPPFSMLIAFDGIP